MSGGRLLITGSNRGLGRAIAEAFHEKGYQIASLNRTLCREEWLGEIPCDLRDPAAIPDACRQAVERLSGIDVCICNAAIRKLGTILDLPLTDWQDSLTVNLTSVFVTAQCLLPVLRQSRGHLVVIGSQASGHPFEGGAAYCASKAALERFCDVFILENRDFGVRCTLVTAGAIRNRPKPDDDWKIRPEEVAQAILRLTEESDPRSFIRELEIVPTRVPPSAHTGMERLQRL